MADIPIISVYAQFEQKASGIALALAKDIDSNGMRQSEINDNVIQGKIWKDGEWQDKDAGSASVKVDGETIITNDDGKLSVPIDGKTIKVENSKLSVNVDGTTIQSDSESGVLSVGVASTDILGGIKVANVRTGEVEAESGGTGAINRYYGVELDENGKAFVHGRHALLTACICNRFLCSLAELVGKNKMRRATFSQMLLAILLHVNIRN